MLFGKTFENYANPIFSIISHTRANGLATIFSPIATTAEIFILWDSMFRDRVVALWGFLFVHNISLHPS